METKTGRERVFSVELASRTDLRNITLTNGTRENVLIEGTIGELTRVEIIEGVILEIVGEKGVLRIDIGEDEIVQATHEKPFMPQTKSLD